MCGCWAILSKVGFGQNSGQLHCGRRVVERRGHRFELFCENLKCEAYPKR